MGKTLIQQWLLDSTGWSSRGRTSHTSGSANDYSESNLPWQYPSDPAEARSLFISGFPSDMVYVPLTGSGSFRNKLLTTCNNAASLYARFVVELPAGDHILTSFELTGTSGDVTYAHGFYHPNLAGFLGKGPDQTSITMAANSMSQAQLDAIATMGTSSNQQMSVLLLGGGSIYCAGIKVRAADQQIMSSMSSEMTGKGIVVAQPAPHSGVSLGQNRDGYFRYCAFIGAGRACYPSPPWECANMNTQLGTILLEKCEMDGRRDPALDPARPRRCTFMLANNEDSHTLIDCWLHDSNVSRYAVNDQNYDTSGPYTVTHTKIERVGNGNVDPNLNGGTTLGGYSAAVCCGYETVDGIVTFNDPVMSVDYNGVVNNVFSCHIGFTTVGTTRGTNGPQGGRLYVNGGTFRNTAFPQMDGYLTVRVSKKTYWYLDGYSNTIVIDDALGSRKSPWVYVGTTPPTQATINAAGISPTTHYILHEIN